MVLPYLFSRQYPDFLAKNLRNAHNNVFSPKSFFFVLYSEQGFVNTSDGGDNGDWNIFLLNISGVGGGGVEEEEIGCH
ncbi:hypothetical protein PanWU01x14_331920 [Parasponia andersonii]|uniref:Uncharacterized protein n=1 Tax=Parasponia andersonii TaxID=3476 RepID=A0A2P5AHH0_PARAD|nr:hypothetical protein PanWU01x14_331920 [Parasponia andersonii]